MKHSNTFEESYDVELTINFTEHGTETIRREECHGIHYFKDYEVDSTDFNQVVLEFDNISIDLTNRLTQEELELLRKFLCK